jgi:heat shock protein HslJ
MYTTQDEMIKLHKMAVTMMACPDMSVEQTYLEKMDQINKYKLVSKKVNGVKTEILQLFIDDALVAQFKATPIQ